MWLCGCSRYFSMDIIGSRPTPGELVEEINKYRSVMELLLDWLLKFTCAYAH